MNSSSVHAVISGDLAYNGVHQWLAQTDHEKRMQGIASVEQTEALDPQVRRRRPHPINRPARKSAK